MFADVNERKNIKANNEIGKLMKALYKYNLYKSPMNIDLKMLLGKHFIHLLDQITYDFYIEDEEYFISHYKTYYESLKTRLSLIKILYMPPIVAKPKHISFRPTSTVLDQIVEESFFALERVDNYDQQDEHMQRRNRFER